MFSINAINNIYSLFNPMDLIQVIIAIGADADCSEIEIRNLFKVFFFFIKTDVNKV